MGDGVGSIGLKNILGGQKEFVKKATEQKELAIKEFEDNVEVKNFAVEAVSELENVINKIKTSASVLTDPFAAFENKITSTVTSDVGAGSDYLTNVRVDNSALVGDTKVSVAQTATAAEIVLGSAANTGFDKTNPLNLNGAMTLNVGGHDRIINIAAADTLDVVLEKINQQFVTADDQFEAFLVQGNNNTAFIEVRSKETGAGNINIALDAGLAGNINTQNQQAGQNAIVYVNGVQITQASNKFTNVVDGLSFELTGKVNSNNADPTFANYGGKNYNLIRTTEDRTAIKKAIIDFGNSLNELSYFIGKQKDSALNLINAAARDPYAPLKDIDSPDNALSYSMLLIEAEDIWQQFTSAKQAAPGDIVSIYDLGMGLRQEIKDGIKYDSLYFEDEGAFTKAFADDPDRVKRFFITSGKITANDPTNLSYIQFLPGEFDTPLSGYVANTDIIMTSTFDAGGALTGFTATVGGADIAAIIDPIPFNGRYNAKFPADSPLSGLEFSIDPKGAANKNEYSTFNYNAGMANIINYDLRMMISDDGQTGSIVREKGIIQDEIGELDKKLAKDKEDLEKFVRKLSADHDKIMMMDMMAAIQQKQIEAAMGMGDD